MPDEDSTSTSENDWLVISCPSCGRQVKLRDRTEAKDLACAYCSAPLYPDDAGEEAEETVEPIRIKRRSKSGQGGEESPQWDQDPKVETGDEADVSEYVEVDPNDPDSVRVRRVRRKRLLTPAQKVARTCATAFVALITVGGVILLIIAIYKGADTATRDMQASSELPSRIQELINAASAGGQIPDHLTSAEREAATELVKEFLAANGWLNKLPYVYNPPRAKPRMQSWYSRVENSDAPMEIEEVVRNDKSVHKNGLYIIKIAVRPKSGSTQIFALRQLPNDIKIDWETSVGYQDMPLAEFKERRPTEPVVFRAFVQLGDYYNYEFADSSRYQCLQVTYPLDDDFKLFAYADKGDPKLEEMANVVAAGGSFSALIKLRYPTVSSSANQAELTELIAIPWFE